MLAFFKRRWFLLSCAATLFACSMLKMHWEDGMGTGFYIGNGYVGAAYKDLDAFTGLEKSHDGHAFHVPTFGKAAFLVVIPLWLPLAPVLGWLVIRELRWREKRAKAADQSIV